MDQKLLKSYDKQFMKMAMLKHEEIFREQVYELHRLYRVQKILMNSTENSREKKKIRWISSNDHFNGSCRSDQRQGEDHIADLNSQGLGLIEESEIQLTLGPSIYKTNQNRLGSRQSLSSSNSTGSSQNPDTEAPTMENSAWEFTRSSKDGIKMNLDQEHLDGMKQHPPWLFQALSLKLT